MRITATQDFLDGTDRYVSGEHYELDDERARYFLGNGWATSPDAPAEWSGAVSGTTFPAEVDIEAHDATSGQSAQV